MVKVLAADCVTANKFIVGQITGRHIRLDHKYYGSVTAILGQSLTNVEKIRLGDRARVTMALMPDMKTLYCVKASISGRNGIPDSSLIKSLHMSINSLQHFNAGTALDILRSRGFDANGIYVGIGRLAEAFKAIMWAKKAQLLGETDELREAMVDGLLVTVPRPISAVAMTAARAVAIETNVSRSPQLTCPPVIHPIVEEPPTLHHSRLERAGSRNTSRSAPLLSTPSVSPDVGMSNETTTVNTKKKKRQREQSPEQEPAKRKKVEEKAPEIIESAPVKRMGRREIIARMKKAILESSEILTMMANIDAELFAEIVQR